MTTEALPTIAGQQAIFTSARDLLAIGFRHKRPLILCFCGILIGTVLAVFLQGSEYRASTKLLIERERLNPVVTAGSNAPVTFRGEIAEEELNSEVELLESVDVLRQVIISCDLASSKSLLDWWGGNDEERRIERAVVRLRRSLKVEPIRKSDLISVTYTNRNPYLAARVLATLNDAYVKKNIAVHRPPGQFAFFDQEAEKYRSGLSDAEAQLKVFSGQEGGVAPQLARDITLQKLNEFSAGLQQTEAEMATSEKRMRTLENLAGTTPQRLTTQSREIDDAAVLQGLKNTLMNLEIKRTELLTKYQPTYPLVQEVDKQIATTRDAIADEERKPLREETTDRNPTFAWINEELAKARAEYSGLQARAAAIHTIVDRYRAKATKLERMGIVQQDLLRTVKTQEENYLLYQRKREEARMTDALDRSHILNVVVVEQPNVPALPANSPWPTLIAGVVLAVILSLGCACVLEYLDSSFRTPSEVVSDLRIPVLAAVPHLRNGLPAQLKLNKDGHALNNSILSSSNRAEPNRSQSGCN